MEVQIKAVDSFSHDRLHAHIGRKYPVSKATADEPVELPMVMWSVPTLLRKV